MKEYFKEPTNETPLISFKPNEGHLTIEGRSIPENSFEFYGDFLSLLDEFKNNPNKKLQANFNLEYFNTSSSKSILDILKKIRDLSVENCQVSINWLYDAEDIETKEIGDDFSKIINFPFNYVEIED